MKSVYDFTKRSKNFKLMKEGGETINRDEYEFERRCDSKIEPDDLAKLETELKKK